jgi:hypothetical protein
MISENPWNHTNILLAGTDGLQFKPYLTKDDDIIIFDYNKLRNMKYTLSSDSDKVGDVSTYRYEVN